MTADELRSLLDNPAQRAAVGSVELTTALLDRIGSLQDVLHAFITVVPERALEQARRVDAARARGRRPPLDGMPIAVKDNIDVGGVLTTEGTGAFAARTAFRSAPAVARLEAAGAVVLGKLNLHELAFGPSSDNPHHGFCRNPWDLQRAAGGSSSGSAVAIAADLCAGALGTDTGGSIRIPAALTGVSGLRPSPGLVSLRGTRALGPSLDTVGPLARSAETLAELLSAMAGTEFSPYQADLRGLKLGVPAGHFFEGLDPEVEAAVTSAIDGLRSLGADVSTAELGGVREALADAWTVTRHEAFRTHRSMLRRSAGGLGADVEERLLDGAAISRRQYEDALRGARSWRQAVRSSFEAVDLLVTPTVPRTAPSREEARLPDVRARLSTLTLPLSLALVPSASVPCGFTSAGLPIGMQLAAKAGEDDLVLRVASAYQRVSDWHLRRPSP